MKPGASDFGWLLEDKFLAAAAGRELPGLIAAQIDISRPISTTASIGSLK